MNNGIGFIIVNVYGSVNALPLPGTIIQIKDKDNNLISELTTDEDGASQTIELSAPSSELTLEASYTDFPYSTYNIYIEKDGYHNQITLGVQVFDGETTILPVDLTPLLEGESENDNIVTFDVNKNSLLLAERSQPNSFTMPRVLKEVVIPTYITVHIGTPNDSGKNIRVPFIDYLKNVASHEIYPTWPYESLKANIYCQITFALNRIYTEWYPSRGYAFNITNSTAFDQYYVEGGNIFQSVSVIVDEIFNQYVRRKGFNDPYFTEYCSGSNVTCSGLSQWGTVDLAQRGFNALSILRNYYPNDVEIVTSNNIQSIPSSYPGYVISRGSSGENVVTIQKYLNRIRANFPLIPEIGATDGIYGSSTENAVKVFQSINYLPETGTVGSATWYRLSYIYVAVTKLAELVSEGERIGISDNPPTSVLSQGSRGADVLQLQFLLNFIGKYYNTIPPVAESNIFDNLTRLSVIEFQKAFGLTHDGIVGPTTWSKLYSVYKGIENTNPPTTGTTYPGSPLKVGSIGTNVRLMQTYLNSISNTYSSIPKLTVDGIFGNGTRSAVLAFQRLFGLTADGIIGPATWNKIVEIYNNPGSGSSTTYPGSPLKVGSSGNNVRLMQTYLNFISNSYSSIPKLTVDGIFGSGTQSAVLAFQRLFGLTQDGIIGPATWNKIVEIYNTPSSGISYPGTALKVGLQSQNVRIMQQYLNTINNVYTSIPEVVADGIFGNATKTAVIAYQKIFGLTQDGIIGQNTWNSIVSTYNAITSRSIENFENNVFEENSTKENLIDDSLIENEFIMPRTINNIDKFEEESEIQTENKIQTDKNETKYEEIENETEYEEIKNDTEYKEIKNEEISDTANSNMMNTMRTLVFTGMLLNKGFYGNGNLNENLDNSIDI